MGVCRWPDGHNQDGYEALWEHLAGQKLEYAPPRYNSPPFILSQNFPWRSTGLDGVTSKHLGYFNECGPNAGLVRLEPGAKLPKAELDCIQIVYVTEGSVDYAGETYPAVSCFYYPPGAASEEIESRDGAILCVIQVQAPTGEVPPLKLVQGSSVRTPALSAR
jgi:hypothetical protein